MKGLLNSLDYYYVDQLLATLSFGHRVSIVFVSWPRQPQAGSLIAAPMPLLGCYGLATLRVRSARLQSPHAGECFQLVVQATVQPCV